MARIMINCPIKKQPVSTGLQIPKELYETINIRETTTKCPACGKVHIWTKKESFLSEG